ncbi:MAG: nicotinate phosphoribosyltransferase [Actinomycetota bacterium]
MGASTIPSGEELSLLTDLYQLTMLQSYWRRGMNEPATFDLSVRHLPPNRRFLIACGLMDALAYLETLRFTQDAIGYLSSLGRFDTAFLDRLGTLRFTGEVWAIAEGEAFFAGEPLLRVTAPLPEAQVVETFLLNTVLYPSAVASKAARCVLAAGGRDVVDFSLRRDHGADAALKAARAAWIAGAAGTSNVLAGKRYGIPLFGTMAHSFVMAADDEESGFRAYAEEYPDSAVLLVDTYDTEEGVRIAARVGRDMAARGRVLRGIRLDSGDIVALARAARGTLDDAGLQQTRIFVSGDLNEQRIAHIVASGAPVDAFGVGTELGVVADAPVLPGVYKLAEYAGRSRAKRSAAKPSLGGRKQVWRRDGSADVIAREGVDVPGARALLGPVMQNGRVVNPSSLEEARDRCAAALGALPASLRDLAPCPEDSGPAPEVDASLR